MPISGENRCMLPPRPCEKPVLRPNSSAISSCGVHPLGQRVAVAAMRAEDDVVVASGEHTRRRRSPPVADVGMARAVDQASLVHAGELLFRLTDGLHRAVGGESLGRCHGCVEGVGSRQ